MAGMKLEAFQGLIPRTSERLLPPMAATVAKNCKLLSGELRGFRSLREVADFGNAIVVRKAYRIVDNDEIEPDAWLTFNTRDVDVLRSPIIDDSFDRYYWAGDGAPKYNTAARIRALPTPGNEEYTLGVDRPTNTPTVTPPAGTDETRAYVYTYETIYGEESAPSDPTLQIGDSTGTWVITGLLTPPYTNTALAGGEVNIYRTIPDQSGSTVFFYVGSVPIGTGTFNDTLSNAVVADNNILESTDWAPPSPNMEGFVVMPNGYMIGWEGRRLMFSEPYRPHAWPVKYELSTEFPIVGLVVWGSTVVIGTKSQPYFGGGTSPAAFTTQKMDAVEPCLSRRGMVATLMGAYYPSLNGLCLANSSGVRVITQDIMTKEEWARYNPEDIYAAQLGLQYIAFNSENFGFIFNPTEPATKLVELDRFDDIVGIESDNYTGDVLLLDGNRAWSWDTENSERLYWSWTSKQHQFPRPLSFGAVRVNADFDPDDNTDDVEAYYLPYNEDRFAAPLEPLGTLGGHVLCGANPQEYPGQVANWTEPEIKQPLAGSGLYSIGQLSVSQSGIKLVIRIRKSNEIIFDTVVTSDRIYRIPTGFKSDLWKFELHGNCNLYSVQIAETAKGLAAI